MAADVTIWLNEVESVTKNGPHNTFDLNSTEGRRHITFHCHWDDEREHKAVPVIEELIEALTIMRDRAIDV